MLLRVSPQSRKERETCACERRARGATLLRGPKQPRSSEGRPLGKPLITSVRPALRLNHSQQRQLASCYQARLLMHRCQQAQHSHRCRWGLALRRARRCLSRARAPAWQASAVPWELPCLLASFCHKQRQRSAALQRPPTIHVSCRAPCHTPPPISNTQADRPRCAVASEPPTWPRPQAVRIRGATASSTPHPYRAGEQKANESSRMRCPRASSDSIEVVEDRHHAKQTSWQLRVMLGSRRFHSWWSHAPAPILAELTISSTIWSRWAGMIRRPTVYETVALPLSYTG